MKKKLFAILLGLSLSKISAETKNGLEINQEFKTQVSLDLRNDRMPTDHPLFLATFPKKVSGVKTASTWAIHACVGIVNQPTVTAEYRLLSSKSKPYNHLFTSIGFSRLSFLRDEGYGIELKAGGQLEMLEFNVGAWLALNKQDPYIYNYRSNTVAIQLGIRTRSLKNRGFFRCGVGYPDGIYIGGGVNL
ncbi:MAG: hypothetical protein ACOVOL_05345 [Bacteroidia bacterium]